MSKSRSTICDPLQDCIMIRVVPVKLDVQAAISTAALLTRFSTKPERGWHDASPTWACLHTCIHLSTLLMYLR